MEHGVYARTTSGVMITEEDIDKYEYSKEDIVGIVIISDICNPFEIVVDEKLEENQKISRELFDNLQDMTFSSIRGLMPHEALEVVFYFKKITNILNKLNIKNDIFDDFLQCPSWVRGCTTDGRPFLFASNGIAGSISKNHPYQYLRVRDLNLN